TDLLPTGLGLVSAAPSQGAYNSATGLWTVGQVEVAATATLTVMAQVLGPNPATNVTTVSQADQFDPDATNNTASATETPQQADLHLTKAVSNARPNAGATVPFTVPLRNAGPDAATGVAVTALLPGGLTFLSAVPSLGSYDPASGIWAVGRVT